MLKSIDVGTFMHMVNDQPERPIRTYLYMDHNRLFARGKEREHVMNFLLGPSMVGENNVDILPIIGSKGDGRTSLALHCCYDPKVEAHFSLKLYDEMLYLANDHTKYDFLAMLQYLLKRYCNFTNITSDDVHTLTAMLKQSLSSERFLLILDDVWHVDFWVWNLFRDCLRCGKQGSKVILIFNFDDYENYKKIVNPGEVEPVIVDRFSEDEYTSFFEEHAFGSVDPEEYPELTEIGREIAKEWGGSLWGAKIFGELLRDHLNVEFWSTFLRCAKELGSFWGCGNLFAVSEVISHMLLQQIMNNLQNCKRISKQHRYIQCIARSPERDDKLKSYRELMVLSPNHCTPTVENKTRRRLSFLVTEHVFLNKCTFIEASTCDF